MLFLIVLAALIIAFVLFLNFNPQFGGKITQAHKARYAQSKQWDGKKFVNETLTEMDMSFGSMIGLIKEQFTGSHLRKPKQPIPIIPFDKATWKSEPEKPKFVWYGHSVVLLQLDGKNILIDPMLGRDTSPIAPFKTKRFSENTLAIIDQLPQLDAILLTHDHYDHLDLASIKKLKSKVDTWFVALGVARHLEAWGISSNQITEFDWWDNLEFEGISITFTPSRHFSGRGLTDRAKSLWGGWVFKTSTHSIYWTGDSGESNVFKTVGEKLGPFDWAFVECGQYNERWHAIHMFPEEAVQAALDSKSNIMIPVHWAGFPLSLHTWKDPIERCMAEAKIKAQKTCTPQIGQIVIMKEETTSEWWKALE
ncbi:MBL fold metallo-hydrolase [Roseivirga seohaensis]|uniref:MBL fold metallo-hydrolase n=1 Tax=Roseivirga seohaensis TaxID=1914963 RepID=UPI003BA9E9C5